RDMVAHTYQSFQRGIAVAASHAFDEHRAVVVRQVTVVIDHQNRGAQSTMVHAFYSVTTCPKESAQGRKSAARSGHETHSLSSTQSGRNACRIIQQIFAPSCACKWLAMTRGRKVARQACGMADFAPRPRQ